MSLLSHIFNYLSDRFTVYQRVVDGSMLLGVYDVIIVVFFIFDTFLRLNMNNIIKNVKTSKTDQRIVKYYYFYLKHGFIIVGILLFLISIGLTIYNEGLNFDLLFTITLSFLIYTIFIRILLRVFVNEDSHENILFIRYINLVSYIILGNYFIYLMPFVKLPSLFLTYIGLVIGILVCFYIMIHAILNPEILRSMNTEDDRYADAYGILKGMLAVVICILAIEYLMVFSCYQVSPDYYSCSHTINAFDMFYYLIITFTTIGYGDIYPIAYNGLYYSQVAAIIIGITSMFTTGCFVAAVISTANSLAEMKRARNKKKQKEPVDRDSIRTLAEVDLKVKEMEKEKEEKRLKEEEA